MNLDNHARLVGSIIGNLLSLEFLLRFSLYKKGEDDGTFAKLHTIQVGDTVIENSLTDYSTLKALIERYNQEVAIPESKPPISLSVVDLRDALAHGRTSTNIIGNDLQILKFSKPQNGFSKVVFAETMTEDWLENKKKLVYEELIKLIDN